MEIPGGNNTSSCTGESTTVSSRKGRFYLCNRKRPQAVNVLGSPLSHLTASQLIRAKLMDAAAKHELSAPENNAPKTLAKAWRKNHHGKTSIASSNFNPCLRSTSGYDSFTKLLCINELGNFMKFTRSSSWKSFVAAILVMILNCPFYSYNDYSSYVLGRCGVILIPKLSPPVVTFMNQLFYYFRIECKHYHPSWREHLQQVPVEQPSGIDEWSWQGVVCACLRSFNDTSGL